jgi:hypothetical protein
MVCFGNCLGGKFECSPEAFAITACFWSAFLRGNFYDWCLVPLESVNDVIFEGKPPLLAAWKAAFKALVIDHFCRIKSKLYPSIKLWFRVV